MKRTPLKRMSAAKRRERKDTDGPRAAYVHGKMCAVFDYLHASECHEICAGSDRKKAVYEPACWLAVSHIGHRTVQYESKARQLARKLLQSPETFSMAKFNDVYSGVEGKQTLAEVLAHLRMTEEP